MVPILWFGRPPQANDMEQLIHPLLEMLVEIMVKEKRAALTKINFHWEHSRDERLGNWNVIPCNRKTLEHILRLPELCLCFGVDMSIDSELCQALILGCGKALEVSIVDRRVQGPAIFSCLRRTRNVAHLELRYFKFKQMVDIMKMLQQYPGIDKLCTHELDLDDEQIISTFKAMSGIAMRHLSVDGTPILSDLAVRSFWNMVGQHPSIETISCRSLQLFTVAESVTAASGSRARRLTLTAAKNALLTNARITACECPSFPDEEWEQLIIPLLHYRKVEKEITALRATKDTHVLKTKLIALLIHERESVSALYQVLTGTIGVEGWNWVQELITHDKAAL